jgi:hypothetical protein
VDQQTGQEDHSVTPPSELLERLAPEFPETDFAWSEVRIMRQAEGTYVCRVYTADREDYEASVITVGDAS